MSKPTKESFLKDVEKHAMKITFDSGVNRNLVFSNPEECFSWFGITTWLNHLCIYGDMGTFVFSRVDDMFKFFRNDELKVNLGYWSEKVTAESAYGNGINQFSLDKFMESVLSSTEYMDESKATDLLDKARSCEDEMDAVAFIRNDFPDYWEYSSDELTYHYIWCCYAIVWAIQRYDLYKSESGKAA